MIEALAIYLGLGILSLHCHIGRHFNILLTWGILLGNMREFPWSALMKPGNPLVLMRTFFW